MKKIFETVMIIIIFLLLLCGSWAKGQICHDEPIIHLGKGYINKIAYSPDGKLLALAGNVGIWLHDANNLAEIGLLRGHTGEIFTEIVFSPDGKTLVSGDCDGIIHLWNIEKEEEIAVLRGHTASVSSLAFSPDGKTIASASRDGTVRLWDVEEGREITVLDGHTYLVPSVAFSPDGKTIAWAKGADIHWWDVKRGKETAMLETTLGEWPVTSIAFSPNGKMIAVGEHFPKTGVIYLWDVEEKRIILQKPVGWSVSSVTFSPDGKIVAFNSCHDDLCCWQSIGLLDIAQKEIFAGLRDKDTFCNFLYPNVITFSPNGKTIASTDGFIVRLWDVDGTVSGEIHPTSVEPTEKELLTLGGMKRTTLLQNYPNPFNPETWIPFALHQTSELEIQIYGVAGNLVRTLRLGNKSPGAYLSKKQAAHWNGKNNDGEKVGSGIYFYQMRVGDETFMRKALLLK